MRLGAVLLVCGAMTACKKTPPPPPTPPAPSASSSPIASSAPSATASFSAPPDAGASSALVDLLWTTTATVAVSSRVRNPRDLPEHLVDHRADTAWNGRTGDLVGGWIRFRVPADAHVSHLLINAGFDKVSKTGEDLFTANHRIHGVRVSHDGKLVRDVDLDPNQRAPQRIDIDQGGGEYRLEVLSVESGSHAAWRELVVSELAVMGTPGKHPRAKPAPPTVHVGNFDADDPAPLATGTTLESACRGFMSDKAAALDEWRTNQGGDLPDPAKCARSSGALAPANGPFLEVSSADVSSHDPGMYNIGFEGEQLVLRTRTGAHLMNVRLKGRESAMFWSVEYELIKAEWVTTPSGPVLALQVAQRRVTDSDGYAEPGHEDELHSEEVTHAAFACSAGVASAPSCTVASVVVPGNAKTAVTAAPTRLDPSGAVVFDFAGAPKTP